MSWDFVSVKTVRARKTHKCEQCHGKISPGEEHSYLAGKVEGDFMTYREHPDCRAAWSRLMFDIHANDTADGAPLLFDALDDTFLGPDDFDWLRQHYPAVVKRLGSRFVRAESIANGDAA